MFISISVIVLGLVFVLIAIRQIGDVKLQIWQIMLGGALAVLLTGQISLASAFNAINFDVIFFLFGMFIIGQALEESGYLSHLSYKIFKRAGSTHILLLLILLVMGFASAILMNDTLAIIGTPVVLLLARNHKISPKPMLLALAFAVTIGSVMSPIGNPQNLLIALNGNISNSFATFLKFLFFPTLINLFAAYFLLKIFYRDSLHSRALSHLQEPIRDHKLAILSKLSLILVVILILVKISLVIFGINFDFRLTYIALIAAAPILLFGAKRISLLQRIDWHTLIFFAAMFILMASVWEANFFQSLLQEMKIDLSSIPAILLVSIILSQFISNVPLVALYLPMLLQAGAGTKELMALAAGSTIAGNLFILGAASNVIIIQNAEKKSGQTITFLEFAKIGIPLIVLNVLIYWIFLSI